MDTPIPEFLAEAANRRVSDIFIIAGRPLAEKIDGHLLDRGDRLMPDQTGKFTPHHLRPCGKPRYIPSYGNR